MTNQATFALIEECRAALAEELSAWDIDPPLHHVKQAHDKCVAWLAATQPAPQPEAQALPPEWTPEMSRAVQLYSELGAYAAANLSGAYDLFEEFWRVAIQASRPAEAQAKSEPAALTDERIIELAGLSSNRRVCASNCGAQPCKCYPGMTAAEAISLVRAAIAATQEQKP